MPRSVQTNARRNALRPTAASLRAGCAPSVADAYEDYLNDIVLTGEVRRVVQTRRDKLARVRYISKTGLRALVAPAVAAFEEVVGHAVFPYNYLPSPDHGSKGWKLSAVNAAAKMEKFARLGGWIRAAATLPAVRKVLTRNMTPNGKNSPYTRLLPEDLMKKFPSPGRLERLLWATKKKAQAVLAAYEGEFFPSWYSVASALLIEPVPIRLGSSRQPKR